jgi:hypothetical protein
VSVAIVFTLGFRRRRMNGAAALARALGFDK